MRSINTRIDPDGRIVTAIIYNHACPSITHRQGRNDSSEAGTWQAQNAMGASGLVIRSALRGIKRQLQGPDLFCKDQVRVKAF